MKATGVTIRVQTLSRGDFLFMQQAPLRFGVIGMGGYAGSVADQILAEMKEPSPAGVLVAACDPQLSQMTDRAALLREKGVALSQALEELLARDIDAVWVPVPIDLHLPFARQALAAKKAVLVEKPVAGCIDEFDQFIAARDAARLPLAVGFQNIYDPGAHQAKQRLLDGAIGRITHATLRACWPRDSKYYARSTWAGAMKRGDAWVLDSPANNALAHYINLGLFLLGPDIRSAAQPVSITAELYRANPIGNYDTISARVELPGGVSFLILLTHACEHHRDPLITVHGSGGKAVFLNHKGYEVDASGKTDFIPSLQPYSAGVIRGFARYARGDTSAIVATLEASRPHAVFISAVSQTTPVLTIPDAQIKVIRRDGNITLRALPGIEPAFDHCAQHNQMLHESGKLPWTHPPRTTPTLTAYHHFTGPAA